MSDFDYTPSKIRESVKRSLERLHTDYFDVVHLHDIEFVCTEVAPRRTGNHTSALAQDEAAYGLLEGGEGKIRGEGDQRVLDAFAELRKMKDEGLIKHIGMTGALFQYLPARTHAAYQKDIRCILSLGSLY
jgi:D-arabinose 1-dehydrogenase